MRIELEKFNAYVQHPYYGTIEEILYIDERNIQSLNIEDSVVPFSNPPLIQILLRIVLQENTVLTIRLENKEDRVNLFTYIVDEKEKNKYKIKNMRELK